MNIDSIKNGIVIDHIEAGKAMQIYGMLNLEKLDCTVAIIKNVTSKKQGKKDIIKIDNVIDVDLDVLGYASPNITVDIIEDGSVVAKKHIKLPTRITDIIKCRNPRCITTTEQEIHHIFKLTNEEKREYRCIYCEAAAKR